MCNSCIAFGAAIDRTHVRSLKQEITLQCGEHTRAVWFLANFLSDSVANFAISKITVMQSQLEKTATEQYVVQASMQCSPPSTTAAAGASPHLDVMGSTHHSYMAVLGVSCDAHLAVTVSTKFQVDTTIRCLVIALLLLIRYVTLTLTF